MFESLFGAEMPLAARFFIAFLVVLALIGLTAWLVRRFGANRLGNASRGRQPRLAVIDAATVDGRRRLVLIRRDNVEHLLMIGGPSDLVVEPNIVRAVSARDVPRDQTRAAPAAEAAARQTPTIENGWPLQPATEAAPATRPYRSSATEEPWLAPEPGARPRPADSLTGLAAELSTRLNPPDAPAPAARPEAPARAPAASHEPAAQADHNLAEMAHQLEAALRRAPVPEGGVVERDASGRREEPQRRDASGRRTLLLESQLDGRLVPRCRRSRARRRRGAGDDDQKEDGQADRRTAHRRGWSEGRLIPR